LAVNDTVAVAAAPDGYVLPMKAFWPAPGGPPTGVQVAALFQLPLATAPKSWADAFPQVPQPVRIARIKNRIK
jgi:hypothetical protein